MLRDVLGTETLIEKILEMLPETSTPDGDWPEDTIANERLLKGLSHTKMVNEVNHREPRVFAESGTVEPHPLCSSGFGWHSVSKKWRETTDAVELLGPGIILYMRMLKYFAVLFLLFFVLSLPSMFIYWQGYGYAAE